MQFAGRALEALRATPRGTAALFLICRESAGRMKLNVFPVGQGHVV